MQIDETNVDNVAASHCIPCCRQPSLLDEAIDQDVQVWIAILLKFQNGYVRRYRTEFPSQVGSQLVERDAQVNHGVTVDLACIQRESHEPLQL